MNTKRIVAWLQGCDPIGHETASTKAGCDVRTAWRDSERYEVDFADDYKAEGWQQFDTSQDAHYFGVWINPRLLMILTYCEGDWSLETAPDAQRYRESVQRLIDCYEPGRVCLCIGSEGSVEVRQDRTEFLKGVEADVVNLGDVLRAI